MSLYDFSETEYNNFLDNYLDANFDNPEFLLYSAHNSNHWDEHVTNNIDTLHRNMAEYNKEYASGFEDKSDLMNNTRDAIIAELNDHGKNNICDWFTSESQKDYLLRVRLNKKYTIGIGYRRDLDMGQVCLDEYKTQWISLYLKRDSSSPVGFSVYTAYPDIEKYGIRANEKTFSEPINAKEEIWLSRKIKEQERKIRSGNIEDKIEAEKKKAYEKGLTDGKNMYVLEHDFDIYVK